MGIVIKGRDNDDEDDGEDDDDDDDDDNEVAIEQVCNQARVRKRREKRIH